MSVNPVAHPVSEFGKFRHNVDFILYFSLIENQLMMNSKKVMNHQNHHQTNMAKTDMVSKQTHFALSYRGTINYRGKQLIFRKMRISNR